MSTDEIRCTVCRRVLEDSDHVATVYETWNLDPTVVVCEEPGCAVEFLEEQCGVMTVEELREYIKEEY